jgi:hypothetical protein
MLQSPFENRRYQQASRHRAPSAISRTLLQQKAEYFRRLANTATKLSAATGLSATMRGVPPL